MSSPEQVPVVRLARSTDLAAICTTDAIAESETARRDRIDRGIDDGAVWVTELDRRIVGYGLLVCSFFGRAFIELVVIHPVHRGRGLGPLLIRHLEAVCPQDAVFTSTNASNTHMKHVLEKLDYQPSGIIHNLDPGDPEIVYFKALRKAQ